MAVLRDAGVAVPRLERAAHAEAAVTAADRIGYPVALKLDASGLSHKSDVGGVRVGLADAEAVRTAASDLLAITPPPGVTVHGLVVAAMARPGVELIVGAKRDPQFGPVVIVGLGGVLAEALDDVSIRLAPVPRDQAVTMLDELRGARLLDGFRGAPKVDRDAVARIVIALGAVAARPEVREVDCNPVIAGEWGAVAVDALVVLDE